MHRTILMWLGVGVVVLFFATHPDLLSQLFNLIKSAGTDVANSFR